MARVYSTRAQIIKIGTMLAEHLEPVEGGLFAYDGGWSDDRIAAEAAPLGNAIVATHVATVRQELYGNLRKPPEVASDEIAALRAQVAELQRAALAQAAALEKLSDLHAKLCANLALNRVADVRHLSGKAMVAGAAPNGSAQAKARP